MNYEEAFEYSNEIVSLLFHYCMRIESTGALRRKEVNINSIEMIASPQIVEKDSYWNDHTTELGGEIAGPNRLEAGIELLARNGVLKRAQLGMGVTARKAGSPSPSYYLEYKRLPLTIHSIVPPSEWGVEFLLRTGDDDFVDFIIKRAIQRGFTLTRGHLEKLGRPFAAPEEADVLRALDLDWIEPENRNRNFIDLKGIS